CASHDDPRVVEAVRRRRRHEFSAFRWQGEVPDPQAEATFLSAKLDLDQSRRMPHAGVLALYRELVALRAGRPALGGARRERRTSTAVLSETTLDTGRRREEVRPRPTITRHLP